jgi:hypothetical protein
MNVRTALAASIASFILAFGVFALAQDPSERGKAQPAECPTAQPTPHHVALEDLVGVWDAEVEVLMDPAAPPTKSRGVETVRLCGSLWAVGDFEADHMGGPFRGLWIAGFDSKKGKHVSVWVDSTGDSLTTGEGTCEGKCTKIRSEMTIIDPATGEQTRMREICEMPNRDTRTFQAFGPGPEGAEILWMKGTYRRRK